MKTSTLLRFVALTLALAVCHPVFAIHTADTAVTPAVIFGTGNVNAGWYVFTNPATGLELGLRAKPQFPAPSNDFNNVGNTYTQAAGVFAGDRAGWNFEYSINSNYNGNGLSFLQMPTVFYTVEFDGPGPGVVDMVGFDVLQSQNTTWFGSNLTAAGQGIALPGPVEGANVVQNSLNIGSFDPEIQVLTSNFGVGEYKITLRAFDLRAFDGATLLGETSINVIAVPEPSTLLLGSLMAGAVAMTVARRRRTEEEVAV